MSPRPTIYVSSCSVGEAFGGGKRRGNEQQQQLRKSNSTSAVARTPRRLRAISGTSRVFHAGDEKNAKHKNVECPPLYPPKSVTPPPPHMPHSQTRQTSSLARKTRKATRLSISRQQVRGKQTNKRHDLHPALTGLHIRVLIPLYVSGSTNPAGGIGGAACYLPCSRSLTYADV